MIFLKINVQGFNKDFNTQNALLSMVEKILLANGKKEFCGTTLTVVPKAFVCISHVLLIAKLNAYGFN